MADGLQNLSAFFLDTYISILYSLYKSATNPINHCLGGIMLIRKLNKFLLSIAIILTTSAIYAQAPTYTASTLLTGPDREQIGELDIDKDGSVFFVNRTKVTLSKIATDGTVSVVAGGGTANNLIVPFLLQSDTFPALDTALGILTNVAVDTATGAAYLQIAKNTWKWTPDGQLTRFAGPIGTPALSAGNVLAGLDGPAIDAVIPQPGGDGGAAIGPDGSVYLRAGLSTAQIVKIDPQGVATLYAGTGERGNTGDGGPATAAQIYGLGAIATDGAGNLYLAEAGNGLRKISTDGMINTIVTSDNPNATTTVRKNDVVNGVDPLTTSFPDILYVTALPDGSIAFAATTSSVVYLLATDGKVYTIAGDGTEGYAGDGGPATAAQFNDIWGLTSDGVGNIFLTEGISPRYIRKLTRDTPLTGGGNAGTGNTGGGDTGGGDMTGGATDSTTTGGTDSTSTGNTTTLPTGTRGPVALDLDATAGDQMLLQTTSVPNAGETITVDIVITEGGSGLAGFEATFSYDPTQLQFSSFQTTDVFSGAVPINSEGDSTFKTSVAFLGSSASKDAGSMGQLKFTVLSGFTGETTVTLSSASLANPSATAVEIGPGGAFVVIGGEGATPAIPSDPVERSDFSGDGEVGFSDFITFAGAFGSSSSDSGYDARIDLNDDGSVNFPDFIIFAQLFGQSVSGKPATKSLGQNNGQNTKAMLSVSPRAGQTQDEVTLLVHLTNIESVSAYQLSLNYDASALQLKRAETAQESRIQGTESQSVALQSLSNDGSMILSDVFANTLQNEGALLALTFQVTNPEAISGIDISNVLIADALGQINTLQGAHLSDLNPVPAKFALAQNHPNPFNPETQIGYQLPESGDVSLTIYNLLGQQVHQLVNTSQAAGFYRVTWNGQDALGRSVASGVYFYRLKTNNFSQTKMMVLLK